MKDIRVISRNEASVRRQLDAGYNAFSRQEVLLLIDALEISRAGHRRERQRLNFAHFTPIAWYYEGDVGLHERRPMPEGAINLFKKPQAIDFPRGWRIGIPFRISGYTVNEDGMLLINRSRCHKRPLSPNDVMMQCMQTMESIRGAFILQNKQDAEPEV